MIIKIDIRIIDKRKWRKMKNNKVKNERNEKRKYIKGSNAIKERTIKN